MRIHARFLTRQIAMRWAPAVRSHCPHCQSWPPPSPRPARAVCWGSSSRRSELVKVTSEGCQLRRVDRARSKAAYRSGIPIPTNRQPPICRGSVAARAARSRESALGRVFSPLASLSALGLVAPRFVLRNQFVGAVRGKPGGRVVTAPRCAVLLA